jgi:hypothetical protein
MTHHTLRAVVTLGQYDLAGVQMARGSGKDVVMTEFNSVSCGGVPTISDTVRKTKTAPCVTLTHACFKFGAAMWTIDYALQLASNNFSAAYIHTRESGISYNLFDPPAAGAVTGDWVTGPPYYALLVVAEALRSSSRNVVVDLDLASSRTQNTSTVAGYSIYDGGKPSRIVFFNFSGSQKATFAMPGSPNGAIAVRYLTAPNVTAKAGITWNGMTVDGTGVLRGAENTVTIQCQNGCSLDLPAPGVAVVFLNASQAISYPSTVASPAIVAASTPGNPNAGVRILNMWSPLFSVVFGHCFYTMFCH